MNKAERVTAALLSELGLTAATAVESMRAALGRFAENGDLAPAWPAYDLDTRSTFLLDDVCSVASDPDRDLRVVWDDVV